MSDKISHKAKVLKITPEYTTVEILVSSACVSCHAKGMCGMSEEKEKVLMLPTDPYGDYNVGDEVEIIGKRSMGLKAVWLSYVVPLAILMLLIFILSRFVAQELYIGLGAVAGVALYYFVIYLLKNRLAKDFVFYIK